MTSETFPLFLESFKGSVADLLDLKTEALVSFYMDQVPVQDSLRYRARRLGVKFANLLIDEKGDLNSAHLLELNRQLLEAGYILGPNREADALLYEHIKNCLNRLIEEKEIWAFFRKFSPPLCHKQAEEIIRETLWPEAIRSIQVSHIRRAVMAAWFTPLRQSTGSCFATAPAILIQKQHPLRFLKDLYDLLSTGQLKRTIGGKEYSVALSLNAGNGDLHKKGAFCPGLKFALESVEIHPSLEIQGKVRELSSFTMEKVLRLLLMQHLGVTEEDITDEEHLSRLQMTPLLARQTAVYYQKPTERAQKVTDWKKKFTKACTSFRTFTECTLLRSWEYTLASLSDVKTEFTRWNLYISLGIHPEQSPGIGSFLYDKINSQLSICSRQIEELGQEYEQATSAMRALEQMAESALSESRRNQLKSEWMSHNLSLSSIVEKRSELVAKADRLVGLFPSLIQQYDAKLQEAFQELYDPSLIDEETDSYDDRFAGFRLVYKHGRVDASQWTAIYSGEQYIECLRDFFSNVERELLIPEEIERDFITELTTALVQFIQQPQFLASAKARSKEKGRKSPWDYLSGGTLQTLLMNYGQRDRSFTEFSTVPHSAEELLSFLMGIEKKEILLMHSPTHAFIFYPGKDIKSNLPKMNQVLDEERQEHILHQVSRRIPEEEKALFIHLFRQKEKARTLAQLRAHLLESAQFKRKEEIIDSVLYENIPLFSRAEAQSAVEQILRTLGRNESMFQLEGDFFGSFDLYQLCKMSLIRSLGVISSIDWDFKIAETMRQFGFLTDVRLFADTNWSGWFFGFVFNPATAELELWRLNRTATQGFPMTDWKQWWSAQNTQAWTVLVNPREYGVE
jgi:hypothetical protein